jgi:hypothetical protein
MECQTCRWWEKTVGRYGQCHRYPPQPMASEPVDVHPVTADSDYCGEYEKAPTDPPAAAT